MSAFGERFPATVAALAAMARDGRATAAQLAVSTGPREAVGAAFELVGGRAEPLPDEGDRQWLCAGRPVTGLAVLLAAQAHGVDLDAPVARWLLELQRPGLERVTLRQLLSYRDGLAGRRGDLSGLVLRPGWDPDRHVWYGGPGWSVAAALVSRLEGRPIDAVVHERVLGPCGMTGTEVAGRRLRPPRPIRARAGGGPVSGDLAPAIDPLDPVIALVGPPSDLARAYRAILEMGKGAEGPERRRIAEAMLREPPPAEGARWGLGVMLRLHEHGWPPALSAAAFGHAGVYTDGDYVDAVVTWGIADPEHDVAVAVGVDPAEPGLDARPRELVATVLADVLTSGARSGPPA